MTQQFDENYKSWWKPLVNQFEEEFISMTCEERRKTALRLDAEFKLANFRYFDDMWWGCHSMWNDAFYVLVAFFKELVLETDSFFFNQDNPEKVKKMRSNAINYFSDQDIIEQMTDIIAIGYLNFDDLSHTLHHLEKFIYNLEDVVISSTLGKHIARDFMTEPVSVTDEGPSDEDNVKIIKDGEYHEI